MNDVAKIMKAALVLGIAEKLPKPLADKLIVESLKLLEFAFSKEDLEILERWLKPPEPATPPKPVFFVTCPFCREHLAEFDELPPWSLRVEILKRHAKECIAIEMLMEAFKGEGGGGRHIQE